MGQQPEPEARSGARARGLDARQVEVRDEVVRERRPTGKISDQLERLPAWRIDLDLRADRAHRSRDSSVVRVRSSTAACDWRQPRRGDRGCRRPNGPRAIRLNLTTRREAPGASSGWAGWWNTHLAFAAEHKWLDNHCGKQRMRRWTWRATINRRRCREGEDHPHQSQHQFTPRQQCDRFSPGSGHVLLCWMRFSAVAQRERPPSCLPALWRL